MPAESSQGGNRRRPSGQGDRRSPHTYTGPDGVLVFGDQFGHEWFVYDRRSGERRGSRIFGQASRFYRAFISRDGEERRYDLRAEEIIDETAFTLERQLAHATRLAVGTDPCAGPGVSGTGR